MKLNLVTIFFSSGSLTYNYQVEMIAVVATSLRQNTIYVQVYLIYMNLVFNGLIPLVSLAILNTLVYLRLREFSLCVEASRRNESVQSREVTLAKVSCLIVAGKKFGF